jgi:dGTPase
MVAAGIGGFEGNAQSLRVLTRLEAKAFAADRSVGLNLTRAALDAASKYPWPRPEGGGKFGVYADDLPVFDWVRAEAPSRRRCFEAQVMDWADDVAYSVHDVEDAVHGGHVDLVRLRDRNERAGVVELARSWYARGTEPDALAAALDRLSGTAEWVEGYDGSLRALAALKDLTSGLIGRFCLAAERATREAFGAGRLTRYGADLVVPESVRSEVAVMKAVAARYVMLREGADAVYERQREMLVDLVAALVARDGRDLQPWLRPSYDAAADDAGRLRAVVDQVASLTDVSVVHWHDRLVT